VLLDADPLLGMLRSAASSVWTHLAQVISKSDSAQLTSSVNAMLEHSCFITVSTKPEATVANVIIEAIDGLRLHTCAL
jgi:hypothetical protein